MEVRVRALVVLGGVYSERVVIMKILVCMDCAKVPHRSYHARLQL